MTRAQEPLTNLSRGKPATQSSVSPYSTFQDAEAEAALVTSGDRDELSFCHTDLDDRPWWQVDLGDLHLIERIEILNRRECSERLRNFTVLASLDAEGSNWIEIYSKADNTEFGRDSDQPFVVVLREPIVARVIKLRVDLDQTYLHIRRFDVFGHEVTQQEAQRLADRMLLEQADREAAEAALVAGRNGFVTKLDGRNIFVDTDRYSPIIVETLVQGSYEHVERSIAPKVLRPGDRVLEVGTALGVVTMAAAAIVGSANVMTFDANPRMIEDASRNFAANGMCNISANVGAAVNQGCWSPDRTEAEFFISKDFWISRFAVGADDTDIVEAVKIPLVCLEETIGQHRANVLIVDIEGGECDLLTGAKLQGIRLIIAEIHQWAVDRRRIDEMVRYLVATGFNLVYDYSGGGMLVLHKDG